MTAIALNQKFEMLPLNKQQEVVDFIDFLLSSLSTADTTNDVDAHKHPYAGCMNGTFGKMSHDFNEPLDDFKDYM